MYIQPRPKFTGDYFLAFGLAQRQEEWDNMFTNMSREKAIECLKSGAKIRHRCFSEDEFVYMKDGVIFDESDFPLTEFWSVRASVIFDEGWSVVSS